MPIREILSKKEIHRDARRLRTIVGGAGGATGPHTLLGVVHSDTDVAAPIEGALVLANATPTWDVLPHPAASGYAMVTDDTTWTIDLTPTWEGRHSWNDGGGVTAYIDEDGSADFNGHIAVGDLATVNVAYGINLQEEFTDVAGTVAGMRFQTRATPGAGSAATYYGAFGQVQANAAQAHTGSHIGVLGQALAVDTIAATGLTMIGVKGNTDVEDAAAGLAAGGQFVTPAVDTGSSTVGYGVQITEGVVGAGSITTLYGLHVAEISAGGTNWSIYSDGGDSYHEDRIKVGGAATVTAQLDVDQNSATGGVPVLKLDQGDVSEQHILASINGADQDFPAILQLDVGGTPTLAWDESDDKWTLTKNLSLLDGDLYLASALGIIHADGVVDGQVLVANGTRYIPGDLSDITGGDAQFVVMALSATLDNERVLTAGDGIALTDGGAGGNATLAVDLVAAWSGLEFNGGDLRIDLDATFDAWTGVHTHAANVVLDDNAGNSPLLTVVGGSNDSGSFYLVNNAVAGDSDVAVSLCADDADSQFLIKNASLTTVAYIDAIGNAAFSEYISHYADADTYIRFQADNITLRAGGADLLDLVEAGTDYVLFGAQADLNGNDLIIDTDGDSYLHASADDVIDLVLATASGELGITINAAEDFTFTANAFNVLTGSSIQLSEYMYHAADADTYLRYQDDTITLRAGGVDMVHIVEGAADYVSVNSATIDSNFTAQFYVMDGKMGVSYSGAEAVYHAFAYGDDASYYSIWRGRRARTSRAAPSAAQSGDILGRLGAGGYGATGFNAASTGYVQIVAAENFTDADMGTNLDIYTAPTGDTAAVQRIRVAHSGRVGMGATFGTINSQLHVIQDSATGAIPVIEMRQDDTDQHFLSFHGTATDSDVDECLVEYGDATGTEAVWIKVKVTDDGAQNLDGDYYILAYSIS